MAEYVVKKRCPFMDLVKKKRYSIKEALGMNELICVLQIKSMSLHGINSPSRPL